MDASDKEFAEAMTLSGSKVELTHDLGEEISNVVVGKVLSMERHPDSDHMWICQVDAGREQPVQIVTGAWNVHVGDLVSDYGNRIYHGNGNGSGYCCERCRSNFVLWRIRCY